MGKGYLIDTNIVIYYLEGLLTLEAKKIVSEILKEPVKISIISKIELLSWNPPAKSDLSGIYHFINTATLLPLDDSVVDNTIYIRKMHKKVKLPDAIIASTCIANNLKLVTRNVVDFIGIKDLQVVNPFA